MDTHRSGVLPVAPDYFLKKFTDLKEGLSAKLGESFPDEQGMGFDAFQELQQHLAKAKDYHDLLHALHNSFQMLEGQFLEDPQLVLREPATQKLKAKLKQLVDSHLSTDYFVSESILVAIQYAQTTIQQLVEKDKIYYEGRHPIVKSFIPQLLVLLRPFVLPKNFAELIRVAGITEHELAKYYDPESGPEPGQIQNLGPNEGRQLNVLFQKIRDFLQSGNPSLTQLLQIELPRIRREIDREPIEVLQRSGWWIFKTEQMVATENTRKLSSRIHLLLETFLSDNRLTQVKRAQMLTELEQIEAAWLKDVRVDDKQFEKVGPKSPRRSEGRNDSPIRDVEITRRKSPKAPKPVSFQAGGWRLNGGSEFNIDLEDTKRVAQAFGSVLLFGLLQTIAGGIFTKSADLKDRGVAEDAIFKQVEMTKYFVYLLTAVPLILEGEQLIKLDFSDEECCPRMSKVDAVTDMQASIPEFSILDEREIPGGTELVTKKPYATAFAYACMCVFGTKEMPSSSSQHTFLTAEFFQTMLAVQQMIRDEKVPAKLVPVREESSIPNGKASEAVDLTAPDQVELTYTKELALRGYYPTEYVGTPANRILRMRHHGQLFRMDPAAENTLVPRDIPNRGTQFYNEHFKGAFYRAKIMKECVFPPKASQERSEFLAELDKRTDQVLQARR